MGENADIPPVIYHYCSESGFRGILASKKLWMSDVHFMNDVTEQSHLIDIAKRVLYDRLRDTREPFIELLTKNFEWMALTPFACCFCEDGDLLSQWCRYADDGKGYAIGFSSSWLESHGAEPMNPDTSCCSQASNMMRKGN